MLKMGPEEENWGKVPTKGKIGWVGACPRNPKYSYRRESGFQQEEEEAHGGARRDQSGQSVQLVAKVGSDRGSTLLEEQQIFLQCHCQTFLSFRKIFKQVLQTQDNNTARWSKFPKSCQLLQDGFRWTALLASISEIQLHAWWVLLISKSTTQDFQITQNNSQTFRKTQRKP